MVMEIIEVVGWRRVNFTDDKGKTIDGYSIYFTMESSNVEGKMAGKMFISIDRYQKLNYFPKPGDVVAVQYDRYGKPADFKLM